MKAKIVRCTHDGTHPVLHVKREDSKKQRIVVKEFKPYFYTSIDAGSGNYTAIDGSTVHRVVADRPSQVPQSREQYAPHWEADILFSRRFLIDNKLYSNLDVESLKPAAQSNIKLKQLYLDIECFGDKQMPQPEYDKVTCIGLSDGESYASLLLDTRTYHEDAIWHFADEPEMLRFLETIVERRGFDVICGWNIGWDLNYLAKRASIYFDSCAQFDLMEAYKSIYHPHSAALAEVSLQEGLVSEKEKRVNYTKLWREDRGGLLARNLGHVKRCVELDRKLKLFDFYQALREQIGLEDFSDIFYSSVLADTLMLRKFKSKYVLPSKSRHTPTPFGGGYVMTPQSGVYSGVAVYDFSRFYPTILLVNKLCPHGKSEALEPIAEYFKLRNEVDEQIAKTEPGSARYGELQQKKAATKYITNAFYGYFAYPGSRLFDIDMASKVTEIARENLHKLKDKAEELGRKVLYADTDSIFVQVGFDDARAFAGELNRGFPYRLKFEKFFGRLLFTGVAKRYAGTVTWEGKKADYLRITGFEAIRGDVSRLTKETQKQLISMLLANKSKEEIMHWLKSISIDDIASIAIPSRINKSLDEYSPIPAHVRACFNAKRLLGLSFLPGNSYKVLYLLEPVDVLAFIDESDLAGLKLKIDRQKMLDRVVRKPLEDLLRLGDIHWEEVAGQQKLL